MNKWGIIGALIFAVAIVFNYFVGGVAESTLVQIALAAFGFAGLVMAAITEGKKNGVKLWKIIVTIIGAVIAGVLCFIGGAAENIFEQLAGLIIAVIVVIFASHKKS